MSTNASSSATATTKNPKKRSTPSNPLPPSSSSSSSSTTESKREEKEPLENEAKAEKKSKATVETDTNLYDGSGSSSSSNDSKALTLTQKWTEDYLQMPPPEAPEPVIATASVHNYFKNFNPKHFDVDSKTWERVKSTIKPDPKDPIPAFNIPTEEERVGRGKTKGEPYISVTYQGQRFLSWTTPLMVNMFDQSSLAYGNWMVWEAECKKPPAEFPKDASEATVEINCSVSASLYAGLPGDSKYYVKEAQDYNKWAVEVHRVLVQQMIKKGMWRLIAAAKREWIAKCIEDDANVQAIIDNLKAEDPKTNAMEIMKLETKLAADVSARKTVHAIVMLADFIINDQRKASDATKPVFVGFGDKRGKYSANEKHVKFIHHAFRGLTKEEVEILKVKDAGPDVWKPVPDARFCHKSNFDRSIEQKATIKGGLEPMRWSGILFWMYNENAKVQVNLFHDKLERGAVIQIEHTIGIKAAPNVGQITARAEFSRVGYFGRLRLKAPEVPAVYETSDTNRPPEFRNFKFSEAASSMRLTYNDPMAEVFGVSEPSLSITYESNKKTMPPVPSPLPVVDLPPSGLRHPISSAIDDL